MRVRCPAGGDAAGDGVAGVDCEGGTGGPLLFCGGRSAGGRGWNYDGFGDEVDAGETFRCWSGEDGGRSDVAVEMLLRI